MSSPWSGSAVCAAPDPEREGRDLRSAPELAPGPDLRCGCCHYRIVNYFCFSTVTTPGMTGSQASGTNPLMGGLLDRYPRGPAYDEMFGADGLPHPHTRALYDALQTLTGEDLARRAEARDRSFRDQ